MKYSILLLLLVSTAFFSKNGFSTPQNDSSSVRKFLKNFSPSFQWMETGRNIPLKQKQFAALDDGLNYYTAQLKGDLSFGIFGLGLYYREKIGIEVILIQQSTFAKSKDYSGYLADKYPGYYTDIGKQNYSSSTSGMGIRLCYRNYYKHFFIEPKFQVIVNSFYNGFPNFRIKEIGTNQYIQYSSITAISGNKSSYHLLFNIAKRFNPLDNELKLEFGLMSEFSITPIRQTITITEAKYGQTGTTHSQTLHFFNPTLNFAICAKFILGR